MPVLLLGQSHGRTNARAGHAEAAPPLATPPAAAQQRAALIREERLKRTVEHETPYSTPPVRQEVVMAQAEPREEVVAATSQVAEPPDLEPGR